MTCLDPQILTIPTKFDPQRFLDHVCSRARRGAYPSWGMGAAFLADGCIFRCREDPTLCGLFLNHSGHA
jgi:hypothetical protein